MDKAKLRYGVARIAQSSVSFLAHTFLPLFGIVLLFAAIVLFVEAIGGNVQWFNEKLHSLTVLGVAVATSISFTQWLLLALVFIVWNISIAGGRILDKLNHIESALAQIRRD
jgi:hypothetical protein